MIELPQESRVPSSVPFASGEQIAALQTRSESGLYVKPTSAIADPAKGELTADMLAAFRGINVRNARTALRGCPIVRSVSEGGRPKNVYYVAADQDLAEICAKIGGVEKPYEGPQLYDNSAPVELRPVSAEDLKVAQLRAKAVREYLYWQQAGLTEGESCARVVAKWREVQSLEVRTKEYLSVSHRGRRVNIKVEVGGFEARTLRAWAHTWNQAMETSGNSEPHAIRALAPERKGRCGAKGWQLPENFVSLIYSLLVGSCASDLRAAIRQARRDWKAAWPRNEKGREPSYDTIRRAIEKLDPDWSGRTLGHEGRAAHETRHSPSISFDRSTMPYNAEWQLDDVTMNWYGMQTDQASTFRPRMYVIMRVATRQWICAVASVTPVTQDQVRAMIGTALASKAGGIPGTITFEHGAVACEGDEETVGSLHELLVSLGMRVHKTKMHRGPIVTGAIPDAAIGNPNGKAVIESAFKRLESFFAWQAGQVGRNERETAPRRILTLLEMSRKAADEGKLVVLPTQDEVHGIILDALNGWNNAPHGGLPEIIDPATGEKRHATPNEWAKHLGDQDVKVMDSQLLPLFLRKGVVKRVTANGLKINNLVYGRFDKGLLDLRGQVVRAFANPDDTRSVYVEQLGRCVERTDAPEFGADTSALHEIKQHVVKADRNQLERALRLAAEAGGSVTLESLQFTSNVTPDRKAETVSPEALRRRVLDMSEADRALLVKRALRDQAKSQRGQYVDRRMAKYEDAEAETAAHP